ncbi:forkhead box protein E4-like isoform X3 [Atheta coriaria]
MHNVNLEELLVLKEITTSISNDNNPTDCRGTGLGGKQMKLEGVLDHSTGGFTSMMTHAGSSNVPVFKDTSSPLGSDSGIEGDSTDGNLSWLLNYKINELPPVPDQQHNPSTHTLPIVQNVVPSTDISKQMSADPNVQYQAIDEHGNMVNVPNKGYATVPVIQTNQTTQPYQFVSNNPPTGVAKYSGPRKPPFTYTELIEHALVEKRELTVSGIYQWISDHFPFYKQNDDRWKNSVRHNLSINPHFRKGSKAVHGAGHLWTIAQKDEHHSWQIKRQKMQQFIKTSHGEGSNEKLQEIELANATASILPSDSDSSSQSHSKRMQPKNVAIEYVIDMSGGLGVVSLEQVVEECGLTGDYLITDLHPAALGLNMSEGEILNADNLYDDLNFPTYELQGE